ncbi:Ankyrin repeat family protein [Euphorbia peplus]|nr:Ankyrin repeat family protein [Euphorbia peplus]
MNPNLLEAAREGDTNKLQTLLNSDNYILNRSCLTESPETILHVSVLANQREFTKMVITKKPELATRLNHDGFGAIHIASANGFVEIVSDFLKFDLGLARLRSSDGRTALHFAVVNGNVEVVKELLKMCVNCKDDLTVRGENGFHLAVKNSQFEAFKVMVEMLLGFNVEELLNGGDQDGNTVLHYAAAKAHILTLRFLLENEAINKQKIELNTLNKYGLTPVDMLDLSHQISGHPIDYEARDLLNQAGAHKAKRRVTTTNYDYFTLDVANTNNSTIQTASQHPSPFTRWCHFFLNEIIGHLNPLKYYRTLVTEVKKSSSETRNALMIVSTLIATVTFQPILNPPGGIYVDEEKFESYANIADNPIDFFVFMVPNTIGFFASLAVIIMMIHKFPLSSLLGLAARCMAASYIAGFLLIGPTSLSSTRLVLIVIGFVVLVDIGRFIYHFACKCYNMIRYNDPVH